MNAAQTLSTPERPATWTGLAAGSLSLLFALACGGGGGGDTPSSGGGGGPAPTVNYQLTVLVSDTAAGDATTDSKLVNPWGLAFGPTSDFWVANQGTSTTTAYDGAGKKNAAVGTVGIPMMSGQPMNGPTGVVFNGSGDFRADRFITVSLAGCVCGWSSGAEMVNRVDNTGSQAVYTGVATGAVGSASYLYAANLSSGKVEVFDASYAPVQLAGTFTDPDLPAGFAPYNIQNLGRKLYVTYAKRASGALRESTGAGLGVVSVFNPDGTFVRRIAAGGALNAPWGLALAPTNFGPLSGALLVGNFGDGRITAFDPATGAQLGQLTDASGAPMAIPGLWALSFGNGGAAGLANQLYVTAGPQGESHGLFATISYGAPGNGGGGTGGGGGYGY